ncbi:hypothetical protein [Furfurilactobacillus cerevisiae]|uniref:hypothetical protein n=1 Tax=Furfurilactobacillus rossiae TaxID=231049 RepID=UPI003B983B90
MQRILSSSIIVLAIVIFGGVVWLTEAQHLTGVTLFALWIGAFILTTVLVTLIKVWQLRLQRTKDGGSDDKR